jgi:ankyrin repeat protein
LDRRARVDAEDKIGRTPLLLTSDTRTARLLVERGANFRHVDNHGGTVLHTAAYKGNSELLEMWIDKGADLERQDARGWSALLCAASCEHKEAVELLLANGASVEVRDSSGEIVLHKAAAGITYLSVGTEHRGVVTSFLLEKGLLADVRDDTGQTPLHKAARLGHLASAGVLLDHGADVSAKDNKGLTALHLASGYPSAAMMKLLLKHGANVNAADTHGDTALLVAAQEGRNVEGVKLLLEAGADIDAKNADQDLTALHMAAAAASPELVELLLAHGADVGATGLAYRKRTRPAPIWDRTPLHFAVIGGVRSLRGPSPYSDSGEPVGDIGMAVKCVRLLLNDGAAVNAVDGAGITPLDLADRSEEDEIAKILREYGGKHGKELQEHSL